MGKSRRSHTAPPHTSKARMPGRSANEHALAQRKRARPGLQHYGAQRLVAWGYACACACADGNNYALAHGPTAHIKGTRASDALPGSADQLKSERIFMWSSLSAPTSIDTCTHRRIDSRVRQCNDAFSRSLHYRPKPHMLLVQMGTTSRSHMAPPRTSKARKPGLGTTRQHASAIPGSTSAHARRQARRVNELPNVSHVDARPIKDAQPRRCGSALIASLHSSAAARWRATSTHKRTRSCRWEQIRARTDTSTHALMQAIASLLERTETRTHRHTDTQMRQ